MLWNLPSLDLIQRDEILSTERMRSTNLTKVSIDPPPSFFFENMTLTNPRRRVCTLIEDFVLGAGA
jgi:hypothetical protein